MQGLTDDSAIRSKTHTANTAREGETTTREKVTTRRIAKDITLERELVIDQSKHRFHQFTVVTQTLKVVEFIADFAGSQSVELIDAIQTHESQGSTVYTETIKPEIYDSKVVEKRTSLARIRLHENWSIKSKFKFYLSNPSREMQEHFIKKENAFLLEQYHNFVKAFKKETFVVPFERYPIHSIVKKLSTQLKKYIDLNFLPKKTSIYDPLIDNPFRIIVHWRRPHEFCEGTPQIFSDVLEPSDIKPGILGNDWFLSALQILAERPALVERLFLTRHVNEVGVYRVKLCKNGEWQIVTVDDLFPCFPHGEPLFSTTTQNDLWVLILEKAYAKLHGGYYYLRNGFVSEALLDLTGCPTISYDMQDTFVKHFIKNGQFWDLLQYFQSQFHIMAFSVESERRWRSQNEYGEQIVQPSAGGLADTLPSGKAFTVIMVREVFGNLLINLRAPELHFEWQGEWRFGSERWDERIRTELGSDYEHSLQQSESNFWMSLQEAVLYFKSLCVCRVQNWHDVRLKGKFLRLQDPIEPTMQSVISKWYYTVSVDKPTRMLVGIHQEDERIKNVLSRRPYMDVGIAVIKVTGEQLDLYDFKDFVQDRQCEIEVNLDRGQYIILPRTTGCTLRRPVEISLNESAEIKQDLLELANEQDQMKYVQTSSRTGKYSMAPIFECTIAEIFSKFDVLLTKELSYLEFKGFCETVGRPINEEEFAQILTMFTSSKTKKGLMDSSILSESSRNHSQVQGGLTMEGFKRFIVHEIEVAGTDDFMYSWMAKLGYDESLYPLRSRGFIMSFHSDVPVQIEVHDAVETDIDLRTNLIVIDKFGQVLEATDKYRIVYTFSEATLGYTYAVQNLTNRVLQIKLDFSSSLNMLYSGGSSKVIKTVKPGKVEFVMHQLAKPNVANFKRGVKCSVREVNSEMIL